MRKTGKPPYERHNIVMAVGRSGGHIFPALGVAEALKELSPHIKIHFIHSSGPLEKKIFSTENYPTCVVPSLALAGGTRVIFKLKTLVLFPLVFVRVFFFILRLKPRAVFGTGGATSAPALLSAFLLGRRGSVWEGNAVAGLANRLLAPFVSSVFTVFPDIPSISRKKQILCGYPLRKAFCREFFIESPAERADLKARKRWEQDSAIPPVVAFKKNKERKTKNQMDGKNFYILILGGSGGSRRLNRMVSSALLEKTWPKDVFVFHQTGEKDFASLQEKYKNVEDRVQLFAFSPKIQDYYKKCDVVFSRAGSGTIAEVSAAGKPLVLVPLSGTAGDHQVKNAVWLAEKNQADWISEKEFTAEIFRKKVLQLKNDREKRELLAQNIKQRHKTNGAFALARFLLRKKKV